MVLVVWVTVCMMMMMMMMMTMMTMMIDDDYDDDDDDDDGDDCILGSIGGLFGIISTSITVVLSWANPESLLLTVSGIIIIMTNRQPTVRTHVPRMQNTIQEGY